MRERDQDRFDVKVFLATAGPGRILANYHPHQVIFSQGAPADTVYYIREGSVKLWVTSRQGKEAIIAMLDAGDFFGEGCLTSQSVRMLGAAAMSHCSVLRIEKALVIRLLRDEPPFAEALVQFMLSRNIRIEEDLVDQLFNSSEKRLARVLLLLAKFGKEDKPEPVIAEIGQETLAEIVGTTRSRVNFFMNRFRKLGFIDYSNGGLEVHSSLLNVVLHD